LIVSMIRQPPGSTQGRTSAASDVYKEQLMDRGRARAELGWAPTHRATDTLRELLDVAKIKQDGLFVQFQGLDQGKGPEGHGSHEFLKSLDVKNPVLDDCIVAYAMNGEPPGATGADERAEPDHQGAS